MTGIFALDLPWLTSRFDVATGAIDGVPSVQRYLADLRGCFADARAYEAALARGNPLVYSVASVEPAHGAGDLHYGLAVVHPGRVGGEYFHTKGHLHQWREAAEIYLGLAGEGAMLLESERTGETRLVPLGEGHVVYVPGYTAHHTINTAAVPLAYLGVYPAAAGHDYGAIADSNFRSVVVERDGRPVLLERAAFHA
ncbi:MAG: glucose-6-phosphate isomerase [Luteitalea sp.]|nr:glucose-6-phosphate isomerase [Luteitalea sp.]